MRVIGRPHDLVRAELSDMPSVGSATMTRPSSSSPPTWVKPQLAKLVEKAPDGLDWIYELKLDGYRMHARLDARQSANPDAPR